MKVINLFGEPSVGKSATMFSLAGLLKKQGFSVEISSEAFKEIVYDNNNDKVNTSLQVEKFGGQLYVLAEQNKRLARLDGLVDFVITDCPLPLISYYTPQNYIAGFLEFSINLFNKYDNVNFLLKRNHLFENNARIHAEEEAKKIAIDLPIFLKKFTKEDLIELKTSDIIEYDIVKELVNRKLIKANNIKIQKKLN